MTEWVTRSPIELFWTAKKWNISDATFLFLSKARLETEVCNLPNCKKNCRENLQMCPGRNGWGFTVALSESQLLNPCHPDQESLQQTWLNKIATPGVNFYGRLWAKSKVKSSLQAKRKNQISGSFHSFHWVLHGQWLWVRSGKRRDSHVHSILPGEMLTLHSAHREWGAVCSQVPPPTWDSRGTK